MSYQKIPETEAAQRSSSSADHETVTEHDRPLDPKQLQGNLNPATLQKMQSTLGNAAVQRLIVQRKGKGSAEIDDETAGAINSKRGSGHALEEGIANKAGNVMGADFSGVNVHTDSQADSLSRSINAKAFTTGNDIFFRSGAYDPASSAGQHLIAHELTHVVQQGSAPAIQTKMTVNDPDDQYEAEADSVADKVMAHQEDSELQRDAIEEDEIQAQEEEEEQAQMQEEEEEQAQM